MIGRAYSHIGLTLVLLVLCGVAATQSAALTSTHEQHRCYDHGCLICHVGSLPFLESIGPAPLAPVLRVQWLESAPDFEAAHEASSAPGSSRAPPAQ